MTVSYDLDDRAARAATLSHRRSVAATIDSLPSASAVDRTVARTLIMGLASLTLLAGCSSDDEPDGLDSASGSGGSAFGGNSAGATHYAFVAGATPSFDAGQIERLTLDDTIVSSGELPATGSDISVATDGSDVYQIGRFQLDTLTRFSPQLLDTPVWQYSVNGDETASNPYAVAFHDDSRAYVVRYGSPIAWVIDPSATTEAEFKIGELDLSAYDADSSPEASDALIVGDQLFILMQRLTQVGTNLNPDKTSYVAVFDIATDSEIDTGQGLDGLKGIALPVTNAESMQYLAASDEIIVTGRGNLFGNTAVAGDPYQGGLVTIDPETYISDVLIDDGTVADDRGFFAESVVVSADKGYLLTYRITDPVNFMSESTLRSFDPRTGLLADTPVAGFESGGYGALAFGPEGRLWVSESGDEPGFILLDPATDAIVGDKVRTRLNPNAIVFVTVPAADAQPDAQPDAQADAQADARADASSEDLATR